VQARARYGEDRTRTAVGLATTFVPWFPDGPPAPTRIAWLWPLVDAPRRAPDELMLDDELAGLVADGGGVGDAGRLHELLSAATQGAEGGCEPVAAGAQDAAPPPAPAAQCRGEAVPITYGVEPSLLHSVEAMTRPYSVLAEGRRGGAAGLGRRGGLARHAARDGAGQRGAGAAVRGPRRGGDVPR
jgi:hypothetical protein